MSCNAYQLGIAKDKQDYQDFLKTNWGFTEHWLTWNTIEQDTIFVNFLIKNILPRRKYQNNLNAVKYWENRHPWMIFETMFVKDLATHIIPRVNNWIDRNSRWNLNLMAKQCIAVGKSIIINFIQSAILEFDHILVVLTVLIHFMLNFINEDR